MGMGNVERERVAACMWYSVKREPVHGGMGTEIIWLREMNGWGVDGGEFVNEKDMGIRTKQDPRMLHGEN